MARETALRKNIMESSHERFHVSRIGFSDLVTVIQGAEHVLRKSIVDNIMQSLPVKMKSIVKNI